MKCELGSLFFAWTARNNMQRGPTCEEDPASPVLFALIGTTPLEKVACDFFE
jgi:hypothetical protein